MELTEISLKLESQTSLLPAPEFVDFCCFVCFVIKMTVYTAESTVIVFTSQLFSCTLISRYASLESKILAGFFL